MIAGISKVTVFSDKARAAELAVVAAALIAGGSIAWWTVKDRAAQAGELARANTARIEQMTSDITDLKLGQVRLTTQVEAEGRATRKDLSRQEKTLDRILDRLNDITPAAGGTNQ